MAGVSRIAMLPLEAGEYVLRPVVVWDDDDVILFDAGLPGMAEQIRRRMEEAGAPFGRLNRIVITHQDRDHIGALEELTGGTEGARRSIEVLAHELAVPYIQGEKPLLKSGQLAPPVKVDRTIADGETLPWCGGLIAIHTPGHTPDHLCFYHIPSRTLIAGDATAASEGRVTGPNPQFTPDMDAARESLKKLAAYDIRTVFTYHGGEADGDALREYIASL